MHRKEVNLLARSSSKKNVLESFATAVQREQARLAKKGNKRKKTAQNSEGESDDDMSVELIESPVEVQRPGKSPKLNIGVSTHRSSSKTNAVATLTTVDGPAAIAKRIAKMREQLKIAKQKANSSTTEDNTLEEAAYQRKLEWLRDHGESDQDESPNDSDESPDDEQTEK